MGQIAKLFGPAFGTQTLFGPLALERRFFLQSPVVVVHCLYQISVETGLVAAQRREVRTSKVYEPSSGAVLAAISNGLRVFFLVNHMNKVELSLFIEANYPRNKSSITLRKPVYGVGTNDAHYMTDHTVNGATLRDPAYDAWCGMLKRAYNRKYHVTHPTYSDVTVCKEWHSFVAFREWWLENYREGFQCDKDLLAPGNKEYSPDTCIYVPRWLNSFLNGHEASRGELPIGVHLLRKTGKYMAQCSSPITGKQHHLGLFTTPEEANEAWLDFKLSIADRLKKEMDRIDKRIYNNVLAIIIVKTLC